ncbi:MAG TPA: RluA family pseudouridine synthase [Thermoanaerobaculia bacterium]|nr:RluA family pseudouridine synthase [Thermoanaerobaculia bacterium]
MRLDLAVSRAFGLSRRAAREAVRAGRVDLEGKAADEPGLEVGDDPRLSYTPDRPARHRVRTRLTVLAEDPDFVVVEKPAGLLTVPTVEREKDTLLARLLEYLHHRFRKRPTAFVVHRLDRDTSGAVVFARTREALHFLQDLFKRHDIEREYAAIVEGSLPDSGVFSADLVRDRGDLRRGVARRGQPGKRAVTRYRVLERLDGAALVSVELETGRTHQIRVHFSEAGHPVVGDRVYGRRQATVDSRQFARQMLHARRLGFADPRGGEMVRVESPLPKDFLEALAQLRRKTKAPRKPGARERADGDRS